MSDNIDRCVVEQSFIYQPSELFVSDNGSNLYSIDLRTGGILYGYKGERTHIFYCRYVYLMYSLGISGAVTSFIPSSTTHMVSTSLDRYIRIHTVVSPPTRPGSNLEQKGGIVEKTYLTSVPTVVVWDQQKTSKTTIDDDTLEHDDLWDQMEHVD